MTMHICEAGSNQGRQAPTHEDVIVVKDAASYASNCPLCEALDQVEKLEARVAELEMELADALDQVEKLETRVTELEQELADERAASEEKIP